VPKKKQQRNAECVDAAPAWQVLQERILDVVNEFADENPAVPNAFLLTGTGLGYVTFATTRYGKDCFQIVYDNLRSIVQLFQTIIDDERKYLPKKSLASAGSKKDLLNEKWNSLESIRKKLNTLVDLEIKRLHEQESKPN